MEIAAVRNLTFTYNNESVPSLKEVSKVGCLPTG